jgi:hypothetical protein
MPGALVSILLAGPAAGCVRVSTMLGCVLQLCISCAWPLHDKSILQALAAVSLLHSLACL